MNQKVTVAPKSQIMKRKTKNEDIFTYICLCLLTPTYVCWLMLWRKSVENTAALLVNILKKSIINTSNPLANILEEIQEIYQYNFHAKCYIFLEASLITSKGREK